ncbi:MULTISPECIES: hypothetical protein [Serratia]|jgi:hypothetical protein|uniref:hypothetical protein n=1 Tax=Serratia TaxID=613 RepID=UPI0027E452BE|nr:hypothetical protein [Serratia marcescens]MCH4195209.1 hypothetical protein [Serratia liquefaciens]MCH4231483.1 hypothetical protein [Serratia liquefaciens]MCH4263112.1 hypothetical protein [Serratia liquefaciens]MCI1213147.1 hypothetical protein [Serratia liquefaciens]MCI1234504.1 hypothetical protein [Serratia liquefaciens]
MQTIMPPINTEDGLFHEGNPSQGTQGTIVTALHLNNQQAATRDIQIELTAILTAAGMLPDGTKPNQVLLAIQKIFTGTVSDKYLPLTGGTLTGSAKAPAFIGQDSGLRIHSEGNAALVFANAAGNVDKAAIYSEPTNDGHRLVFNSGSSASSGPCYIIFEPTGKTLVPNTIVWSAANGSKGSVEVGVFGSGTRISYMQWHMSTAGTWGMYLDHDSNNGISFGVNGRITANGIIETTSEVNAGGEITWNAGNCRAHADGNISGSIWGGYLRDWLSNNTVSRVLRGAQGSMTMDGGLVEAPAGCVLTGGNGNEGNQVGVALYRPLQIWRGGGWVTIEG